MFILAVATTGAVVGLVVVFVSVTIHRERLANAAWRARAKQRLEGLQEAAAADRQQRDDRPPVISVTVLRELGRGDAA